MNMEKKIAILIAWSLVTTASVFAGECNFTCPNNGSTVTISSSCDLTKSIDCRGDNIVVKQWVVVNVKPGVIWAMDLKNHSLTVENNAKINFDKTAKVNNQILPPTIISFTQSAWWSTTTWTAPDVTIYGTYWSSSNTRYSNTFTVPSGVSQITISFKWERQEEPGYDGIRYRIYKNWSVVYDSWKKDNRSSQTFTKTLTVNPGDRIQVGAYQSHDVSVNRWDSYIKNITISYTVY